MHPNEELMNHSPGIRTGNLQMNILKLEKLIEIKKKTDSEKNLIIPILQHIFEEKKKG